MALIAWYPLNGDTKDYSGRNQDILTSVTATVDNNGKIGKCYSFAAGQRIMQSGLSFPRTTSTTMWAYATSLPPSMLFSYNNGYGPDVYFTDNSIHWNLGDGSAYPFKKAGVNVAQPSLNTWHHYAVINDEESQKCYLYIDGDYYGETAWRSTYQTNAGFTIGNYVPADTGYAWRGKINDVRIYDHALSKKEIKEISKAKILHYTFDQPASAHINQIPNATYVIYNNFAVPASLTKLSETFEGSDVYRLSIIPTAGSLNDFKNVLANHGIYGFSRSFLANTKYAFTILWRPISHPDLQVGGVASNIGNWTAFPQTPYKDGWMISGQYRNWTTTQSDAIFTSIISPTAEAGVPIIVDFCFPRLFVGTTDLIPYDAINNVIYDSSGFNNHANVSSTQEPTFTRDSKIGSGALYFDQFKRIYKDQMNAPENITINLWFKSADIGTGDYHIPLSINSTEYEISVGANGQVNIGFVINGTRVIYRDFGYCLDGNWNMITAIYDGQTIKGYLNGVLTKSYSAIGALSQGPKILRIGALVAEDTYGNRNAYEDDVRIYATALSASDILDLYRTRITIDNKGALSEGLVVEDITKGTAKNLILNGDGSLLNSSNFPGMTYVPNTDLPGVKGVFQTTERWQDVAFTDFIPINSSDSYSIGVSARKLGAASLRTVFYLTIRCYDANYKIIQNGHTNIINPACNTTLAVELVDGATTVTVTNGSAWAALQPGSSPWVNIAFATHAAYDGYAYLPKYAGVASISGNTITLENPWNQGTVKVGTRTTATREGSTYEYPVIANLDTIWTSYTRKATFRPGTQYVKIGLLPNLGEDQATIQAGGFFLYNDSRPQRLLNTSQFSLSDKGILNTQELFEVGLPVRYIRDSINGNSRNNSNHWSLIRAFNKIGTNVAIGAAVIAPTTVYPPSVYGAQVVINDTVATSPYIEGGNYCLIDLGQIIDIVSIGVWHYYGDVRTYNDNILEISTDGINWTTVYSNEGKEGYVESAVGNQVILYNKNVNINNKGEIYTETLREVF